MRPSRPSALSASATNSQFGIAVSDDRRSAAAMLSSGMRGLRAHNAMNAAAVERLIPAKQWIKSGASLSQRCTKSRSSATCSAAGGVSPTAPR